MQIKQAVCFLFFDDIMLVSSNTLMPEQVFGKSEHLSQNESFSSKQSPKPIVVSTRTTDTTRESKNNYLTHALIALRTELSVAHLSSNIYCIHGINDDSENNLKRKDSP
jgi:hypothetical protein